MLGAARRGAEYSFDKWNPPKAHGILSKVTQG